MTSLAPSPSILLVAPGCTGESSSVSRNAVVTGNRATARRIKGLLEKEAQGSITSGCSPTVVLCDVSEAEAKLQNEGPWAALVGVHATKAGRALDLAQAQDIPTVCVLGGTDVNVDMIDASHKALDIYGNRLRNCQCVVAFSPSVADALPSILREGIDLRLAPQGVELGQLDHAGWESARNELCKEVHRRFLASTTALSTDSSSYSTSSSSSTAHSPQGQHSHFPPCRLFLLPAHLRPIKDVCFVADAVDASWARSAPSRGVSALPDDKQSQQQGAVAPSVVVLGHALDPAYAQTCWNRAKTSSSLASSLSSTACAPNSGESSNSTSSSGSSNNNNNNGSVGGAFMVKEGLPRSTLLAAYADRSGIVAGVINTSLSEGMSGALLEAMACGCPVLARDIPGNRSLLTSTSSSRRSSSGSVHAENQDSKLPAAAAATSTYRDGNGWKEVESGFLFTTPASFVEAAEVVMRGEAVDVATRAQARAAAFSTAEVNAWGRIVNDLLAPASDRSAKETKEESSHATTGTSSSPSLSPSEQANTARPTPRALSVATPPPPPLCPSSLLSLANYQLRDGFINRRQMASCSSSVGPKIGFAPTTAAQPLILTPCFAGLVPQAPLFPLASREWRGSPAPELTARSFSSSASHFEPQPQQSTARRTPMNEGLEAEAPVWPGIEMFLAL